MKKEKGLRLTGRNRTANVSLRKFYAHGSETIEPVLKQQRQTRSKINVVLTAFFNYRGFMEFEFFPAE